MVDNNVNSYSPVENLNPNFDEIINPRTCMRVRQESMTSLRGISLRKVYLRDSIFDLWISLLISCGYFV